MGQRKVRIEGIINRPRGRRIVIKGDIETPASGNQSMSNYREPKDPSEPRSLINGKR